MKRIISFALILMLLISFAACRRPDAPVSGNEPVAQPTAEPTEAPTEEPSAEPTEAAPTEEPLPTHMPDMNDGDDDNTPAIYAGNNVFFAVRPEGAVYAWGNNEYGQIPGRDGDALRPVYVGSGFTPVIVGDTVFALDSEHTLIGWGRNDRAQLGQGDAEKHDGTVKILENVKKVLDRWGTYYALTEQGELYAWSYSQYDELEGAELVSAMTPHKVFENVREFDKYFIITNDGELWESCGTGETSKLADGVQEAWGGAYPMAVCDTDGRLYALTPNGMELICDSYAYGDGTTGRGFLKVEVSDGVIWFLTVDGTLKRYTASESDVLAETDNLGELETIMNEVVDFDTATYMDEDWGYDYKFALKANGELWSWAIYHGPILGKASYETCKTPECVLTGVTSFTCSGAETYAVTANGEVWACGMGGEEGFIYGSLGDGTAEESYTFVNTGLTDITRVLTHLELVFIDYDDGTDGVRLYCRTFAVNKDGRLFAWGWNGDGLLGAGALDEVVLSPMEVYFTR